MASIAKDPAHPALIDPCMPDAKSLVAAVGGKWMLTWKDANEFRRATLEFTRDEDGFDAKISGPGGRSFRGSSRDPLSGLFSGG